jgi:hypothetical protein
MKQIRLLVTFGIFGILALVGSVALLHPQHATAYQDLNGPNGATYVTTVTDSSGKFSSRGVITLHADHTMSVIDSGQGGPTAFFTSQLGSWARVPNSNGEIIARTIDFNLPPSPGVARVDYTIHYEGNQITGTITLTIFPLTGNPLDGGGTVVGTFTFVGQLVTP